MKTPVPMRFNDLDAWLRFAEAGGFDALCPSPQPILAPFGGTAAMARLRLVQSTKSVLHPRRPRFDPEEDPRTLDIVRRLKAGETLEQAAKPWDITRERARQIAERWFALNETSLKELREIQRQAQQTDEFVKRVRDAPLCCVCLEPILNKVAKGPSGRRTCSAECAEEYRLRPWRYDETRRRAARLANAQHALRNPEGLSESQLAYAQRIVADPSTPFNRRFRVTDQKTVEQAMTAARAFLAERPRLRRDVVAELCRQGIDPAEGLLSRIRRDLDVIVRRKGFGPGALYTWELPQKEERAC